MFCEPKNINWVAWLCLAFYLWLLYLGLNLFVKIIRIFVKSESLFSAIIQKPQEKSYWYLSMETRVMLTFGLQKYVITTSLNDIQVRVVIMPP